MTSLDELIQKAEEELLECDYVLGKKERPAPGVPPNIRVTSVLELLDRHERNKKYPFEDQEELRKRAQENGGSYFVGGGV